MVRWDGTVKTPTRGHRPEGNKKDRSRPVPKDFKVLNNLMRITQIYGDFIEDRSRPVPTGLFYPSRTDNRQLITDLVKLGFENLNQLHGINLTYVPIINIRSPISAQNR